MMHDFSALLQQGGFHAWLFIPTAILLGALHGLEPGHSKTMMAAFIIAVRGTIGQAALLGLCAAISHSLVIWALAGVGLALGQQLQAESAEVYFQFASGLITLAMAGWMFRRTRHDAHAHQHEDSPAPHDHGQEGELGDAHARAHAQEIENKFGHGSATTGQIIVFGLTGGLLPCPASLTVLLLCLQLKKFALGFTLVLSFSAGLALTLVAAGAAAAWGLRHATQRISGFSDWARRAPYFSSALLALLGFYLVFSSARHWLAVM